MYSMDVPCSTFMPRSSRIVRIKSSLDTRAFFSTSPAMRSSSRP